MNGFMKSLFLGMAVILAAGPTASHGSPNFQAPDDKKTSKKQAKINAAQEGRGKAKKRKEVTGRDHQGNHDSLTKPPVRGGTKGDRHDNGTKQNGKAGSGSKGK
jgi:hypothetical protein